MRELFSLKESESEMGGMKEMTPIAFALVTLGTKQIS